MDDERFQHPPLQDSEREVIAHLFDVLFTALDAAKLLPDDVSMDLLTYELDRFRTGHANEDQP